MAKTKVVKKDPISDDMRLRAALLKRFADVREYMIVARKVENYGAVFTAVNPALAKYTGRLYKVWEGKAALRSDDAPMISEMEKAVEILQAA